jgi:hypothetical protein
VTNLTTSGTTGTFTVNAGSLAPGTPYYFAAYAQNGVNTTYTSPVSTFTTLTVFAVWAAANNVANDPNALGANGLANITNFAFGLNPNGAGNGVLVYNGTLAGGGTIGAYGQPITALQPITNGVDFRALYVRLDNYASAGLTYATQFSADLTNWFTSTATPTVLADDGTYQVVSVPYPPFVGGKKARFFRVTLTLPP